MKVIIPMAGLGTRFAKVADQNPEFLKPKPFISVRGLPMVCWATGSLPFVSRDGTNKKAKVQPKDLIFIVLEEHDRKYSLVEGLKNIYTPEIRVISLGAVTRGAAETAHYAKEFVDPEEELIVTDSDHYFDGAHLEKVIERKTDATAGIIPVFLARNEGIPKWSYSLLDEKSRIVHVAEKDVRLMELGAHANIGAYYFSKAKFFFETAEKAIQNNRKTGERDKAEFYVAPLYQDLIERGEHIEAAIIPEVWGLGTPSDLAYFLEHCKQEKPYN